MSPDESQVHHPNQHLHPDVRNRVESMSRETCEDWGGEWRDGIASVQELPITELHWDRTEIESVADAETAFEKYTDFLEYVLENRSKTNETAVLLPCGKMKPIGTSQIHRKKLQALEQAGLTEQSDIVVMSEPCTVIPHDIRLSLPAVNYDFPPEYTEEDRAPVVFETFVDRLVLWLETREYDTIYPYLVKRHQNKFDAAIERADVDTEIVEVPGASFNPDTGNFTGDVFKSVDDMAMKLEQTRVHRAGESKELIADHPESLTEFYRERFQ